MPNEIRSTRVRSITADNQEQLWAAVEALPFKVEIKQILKDGSTWVIVFTVPDNAPNINLVTEV